MQKDTIWLSSPTERDRQVQVRNFCSHPAQSRSTDGSFNTQNGTEDCEFLPLGRKFYLQRLGSQVSRIALAIFTGKLLISIRSDNMPNQIERNPVKDGARTLINGPVTGEGTSNKTRNLFSGKTQLFPARIRVRQQISLPQKQESL